MQKVSLFWAFFVAIAVGAFFCLLTQQMPVWVPPPGLNLESHQAAIQASKKAIVDDDLSLCGLKDVVCPVEDEIKIAALENGWSEKDVAYLIDLAICESSLDPQAVGGSFGCFHGLFQWNTCISASKVDEKCANDIQCSTQKTIEALDRGEQWRWPVCLTQ